MRMATPLLSISDLPLSFRTSGEAVEAVRGVSLEVGRDEAVALVGESGSGKLRIAGLPGSGLPGSGAGVGLTAVVVPG